MSFWVIFLEKYSILPKDMSIIEEKNHHRKDNIHSRDSPKGDGTWSEFL